MRQLLQVKFICTYVVRNPRLVFHCHVALSTCAASLPFCLSVLSLSVGRALLLSFRIRSTLGLISTSLSDIFRTIAPAAFKRSNPEGGVFGNQFILNHSSLASLSKFLLSLFALPASPSRRQRLNTHTPTRTHARHSLIPPTNAELRFRCCRTRPAPSHGRPRFATHLHRPHISQLTPFFFTF